MSLDKERHRYQMEALRHPHYGRRWVMEDSNWGNSGPLATRCLMQPPWRWAKDSLRVSTHPTRALSLYGECEKRYLLLVLYYIDQLLNPTPQSSQNMDANFYSISEAHESPSPQVPQKTRGWYTVYLIPGSTTDDHMEALANNSTLVEQEKFLTTVKKVG